MIGSFFNRDETLFSRYIDHFSKNHQGVLMPLDVVSTYLFLKQVLPCLPYYPINEADVLRIKKRFSDFLDLHIEKTLGEDPKTAFENLLARDLKSVSFFGDSVDFYKVIEKRVCQKYPEGQSLLSPEETKNIKNIFYLDHYLKTFTDEQICAALPFLYECAVKREVFLAEGVFKRAVITLSKNSDYAAFVEPAMKSNFFLENNMTQRNQYSKEDKDRFDLWTSLPLDARLSSKADQALRRKM